MDPVTATFSHDNGSSRSIHVATLEATVPAPSERERALALGLVVLVRRDPLPAGRDLPAIAFCGVTWFGAYNIALNEAERRVDAGTAAMLVNVGPVLIAVLAGLVPREGFPRRLLAGCGIAFAGAVVIGSATSENWERRCIW